MGEHNKLQSNSPPTEKRTDRWCWIRVDSLTCHHGWLFIWTVFLGVVFITVVCYSCTLKIHMDHCDQEENCAVTFFSFFFAPVCQLSFEFCTANMAVLLYSREHSVIKFACHASNIFFIIDQPLSFKEFFSIFCSLEVEKRSYQFQRCLTTPFDHVAVVHVCVCWVKWDLWNCMMTLVYL